FEPDGQPQVATTAEDLARQLESAGLPELEVTSTGLVDLWVTIDDYLTQSQITSVSLAFAAVTIIMIGIFRSLVMGVVLGLLNLSVVILVLGLMGATGIPLDPYTVLIASIALGILDDDTMHFVKSVQEDMNAGTSMEQAIRNTYSRAGQAMFYTTAILVLSFSIKIFSDIASLTKFGVLISLTLLLGLIVEFLITPTLILIFGSRLLNTHQADLPKVSVVKG
ncbi:MAG: MMPL family transporter, partial [Ketobacter sp.]